MSGPTFAFRGTFAGKRVWRRLRWLKRHEHEMSGYKVGLDNIILVGIYLEPLDRLSHSDAKRRLSKPTPTHIIVNSLKSLLCEPFSSKAVEIASYLSTSSCLSYVSEKTNL